MAPGVVVDPPTESASTDRALARLLAPKLKALADETRLHLMLLLAERPRIVRELQEEMGLSQTLVSHHLATLKVHGLVTVTAQGRSNVYTLCCDQLADPVRVLASLATSTGQACVGSAYPKPVDV